MAFRPCWTPEATTAFDKIQAAAVVARRSSAKKGSNRAAKAEGLFKQVQECARLLLEDPRHPGSHTHEYSSIESPYDKGQKVFEAYVQNRTPGAYHLFWCYGPAQREITIIAITPHP